jgi:hypothetical protein
MTASSRGSNSRYLSWLFCAALITPLLATAQSSAPDISLEPAMGAADGALADSSPSAYSRASVRRFSSAYVGEVGPAQALTLRFAETTTLTKISVSKDFRIQHGGSCITGKKYLATQSCVVMVSFTPKSPGNRLGKLAVARSGSATAQSFGLGGSAIGPVVSFIPALITTVPGTYPSSVGLLNGAQYLAVDGGDTLYIADTGNDAIRFMDSGATVMTLATTTFPPFGIAVASSGDVFYDEPSIDVVATIPTVGPPTILSGLTVVSVGAMSIDPNDNVFVENEITGADMFAADNLGAGYTPLIDHYPYLATPAGPIAVDAGDYLYSFMGLGSPCQIIRQSLYDAENGVGGYTKIVGGRVCGYSGDGGQARNARIGMHVGQITFDLAGDLYFSDYNNQRVRRVDYNTGIIRTIAGNGTAGYTGDGASAVAASLSLPTGVGVDSQGQVYIISAAATGQVVRKVGPTGFLQMGSEARGKTSPPHQLVVTNTGNAALVLTGTNFTGKNATDFSIDPITTSCDLNSGAVLNVGQTCKIGVMFKPAAAGSRSAIFELVDNSASNFDFVILRGTGT